MWSITCQAKMCTEKTQQKHLIWPSAVEAFGSMCLSSYKAKIRQRSIISLPHMIMSIRLNGNQIECYEKLKINRMIIGFGVHSRTSVCGGGANEPAEIASPSSQSLFGSDCCSELHQTAVVFRWKVENQWNDCWLGVHSCTSACFWVRLLCRWPALACK